MTAPVNQSAPSTDTGKREAYRFWLAMTILVLFGILVIATMAGGYDDPTILAGMFSGWIVAIIGFYFMDEVSQRSLGQETMRIVNSRLDVSGDVCDEGLRETAKTIESLQDEVTRLTQMAKDYAEVVAFQDAKIDSLEAKKPKDREGPE